MSLPVPFQTPQMPSNRDNRPLMEVQLGGGAGFRDVDRLYVKELADLPVV